MLLKHRMKTSWTFDHLSSVSKQIESSLQSLTSLGQCRAVGDSVLIGKEWSQIENWTALPLLVAELQFSVCTNDAENCLRSADYENPSNACELNVMAVYREARANMEWNKLAKKLVRLDEELELQLQYSRAASGDFFHGCTGARGTVWMSRDNTRLLWKCCVAES